MDNIIRGTTPTIQYTFKTVDPSTITAAYLTITNGTTKLEKELDTATVNAQKKTISWKLSQEETLALGEKVSAMLNWKLPDGTRGASHKANLFIECNLKEVVI